MTKVVRIGRPDQRGDAGKVHPGLEGIRALGTMGKTAYYLSAVTHQIIDLGAGEMSEGALLTLLPMASWAANFPTNRGRAPFDLSAARATLIEAAQQAGIYDETRVRGRGVWLARTGETVVHRGDMVWIDGAEYRPNHVPLAEIYPARPRWASFATDALEEGAGETVLDAVQLASWMHPAHARLFAGWLVVAPICAALAWRPHLWLTGPAGSGKSWLLSQVALPLLGELALDVQGSTTEAGIRQVLGPDARPVIFDEAEAQKQAGQARIERILEFARHQSSQYGGQVLKGGSGGAATSFTGVAAFLLASIGVPLARQADLTRWTICELRARGALTADERYASDAIIDRISGDFGPRLRATVVAHLATIRHNHEMFAQAIEQMTGVRRYGDQLGALLAGELLLHTFDRIDRAEALRQVEGLPRELWSAEAIDSDESRLWTLLFSYPVRADTGSGKRQITRTLGQLVMRALGHQDSLTEDLSGEEAKNVLLRFGIAVRRPADGDLLAVFILNEHPALSTILHGSDFQAGHNNVLRRLPGVRSWPGTVRLPGLQPMRGYLLPAELFLSKGM